MNRLSTLYKDVNGKVRMWKIYVVCHDNYSEMFSESGYIDGKITKTKPKRTSGTKHCERAKQKAKTKWETKQRKGFSKTMKFNNSNSILPMRASDLNKASIFKIKLPACVQAKYDGVRGLYIKGQMYSNSSKLYNNVGHILNELKNIKLDLDGELYSHELPFNVLRGYLQRHEAPSDITKIHYYVFDCINKDPFDKRYQILKNLFEKHKFKYLHMVTCKKLDNYGKIDTILVDYVKQGYEGIIIRNWKGLYLCGKKSPDIFKSKASRTGKFEIVGYKLDIHGETVVWKLKCLHSDETFYSYALGTVQERKRLGKIAKQYLHRIALVRYFDLDKTTGCVTRNPVVIKIL